MKTKYALLIFSVLLAGSAFGQGSSGAKGKKASSSEVFIPADSVFEVSTLLTQPEYPGGLEALYRYLGGNIHYPDEAFQEDVQGTVYVQFVIDKKGVVRDVMVVKGVHPALDEEALRAVREMPRWKPGRFDGKRVKVRFTLPVQFSLRVNGDDDE